MIQVCTPYLNGNEKKYVNDCLNSNWISSSGKYIELFEKEFSKFCGCKYGIAVTNGTTALHLALVSLGIKKGDEVIVPNFTMISSANAICYTGAKPIFVDADINTWNIDVKQIEKKITNKTKAIMVVHIYGNTCNMKEINKIAKKYKLKVIEDSAEAHGAEYNKKKCGNLGDISCFSFFANKILTTGEGGMVLTNNKKLADRCRYFRNVCFGKTRNYTHYDIGFNYRMSNLHAAIGLAQTEKIDKYISKRIKNNLLYRKYLKDVDGIIFQKDEKNSKNVYWMNGILINKYGLSRDELAKRLIKKGIETRPFFKGMNKQPCFKKDNKEYPITDYLSKNGLYLPSGTNLKEKEIKYICDTIKRLKR
jgi:perosamine synthetase